MFFLTGVAMLLAASRNRVFYVEGLECVGLKCENGGTVAVDSSGDSYCACPPDVTGLLCEYRIRESAFPSGPYAIPMSKDGCPEGPGYGWRKGSINITTRLSLYDLDSFPEGCRQFVQDTRSILKPSNASFTTDILGPFDRYTLQMNFCFKLPVNIYGNKTSWPRGNYGVYGSDYGCPTGLSANEFSICIPPVLHYQIDGHVPSFDVMEREDGAELKFLNCRHQDNAEDLNNFDSFYPFMVIKDPGSSTDGCPEPVGYVSKDERFPVPLPTSMRDFNTTLSKNPVPNEYFQISYCHIIPNHFQEFDKIKNDSYTELFHRNEFPAFMYPFVDITTGKYRCDSIGAQLSGCASANTWILVDIRRAVLVSAVVIMSRKENLGVGVSDIFVSDQKWSFLYNGALLCRNKESETSIIGLRAFRCIKPQFGRYVTLTVFPLENGISTFDFSDTTVSILMYNAAQVYEIEKKYRNQEHPRNLSLVSAEIASVINHTDVESKRCHQELGMQDFGILNEQLTASSWQPRNLPSQARPGYSGWCANTFDKYPYIQVDLVFKTLIDGIVIINWGEFVDTYHGNAYGREIVARGSASLHIMYGSDTQNMSRTRDLIYDTSRKLGTPQTFLFNDPFLATYLRMYPRAFPGAISACLKFEILGCRFSDLVNMECVDKSPKQLTESRLNLPNNEMIGIYHNLTSSECEELCFQNVTNCRSTFHPENEACYLYMINKTDNNSTKSSQGERDSLSRMCCLLDEESRSDTLRFHDGWVEYQRSYVTESGILSSVGYPFTYPFNSIHCWKIDLPENFLTLQFMDISLSEFKWERRKSFQECTDTIYIHRMKDDTTWNPFQEISPSGSKFYTIQSDFNGRTPVFSLESSDRLESNFITFYSCSYGNILRRGRGFRVHVSGTDQPFCHSEAKDTYCMLPEMELISRRFLGRPPSFHWWGNIAIPNFWLIGYIYTMTVDGQRSLITLVELKDFDISCYSESYFAITVMDKNTHVYCNGNRPFGKLTTLTRYIYVEYTPRQLQPAVDTVFPEGFRLAYKAIPKDESFQEYFTETNENGDNSTKHVCVRELGKCYSIQTVFSLSWIEVARMCQEKNASIVNIKTAKEMDLLRTILMEHYQFTRSPPLELHIGLMRYKDSSGAIHDHWTDGAPLTYTAWDKDEPSNTIINKCTIMRFHQPDKNNTWRTYSCLANYEPDSALTAVCETKTNSSENSPTAFPFKLNIEEDYILEAKDSSTIHECGSGERVSILAKCNGVLECLDASDEMMCEPHDEDSCTEEEFKCTDGRCIHISKVCDFKEDCMDASDEYCEFPRCTADEFSCSNQQCISSEERCDSVKQCSDGSDEQDCENCHPNKAFQCGDKSCIPERLVCDMHIDCPDGADESSCNHGYKTCDELWRDGYTTNGFFKTAQGYSIYCNFDQLDRGWGPLEMTYPNTDWRQLDENSFRIETSGIENAFENDYMCTQRFSAIPQREKLRVLHLDNKTFNAFEEELPLQGFPSFIISRSFDVSRENGMFSVILHDSFEIFENRIAISGVKCRKFIQKDAGLKEPVLFCRDNVRPIPEGRRCLYSRDESGIIEGCRSLQHLQHCESFICPQSYVKCPNSYCIPSMYVCNGKSDCPDGFDERICACENSNIKLIIFIPSHLSETNEQAYKWRRLSSRIGGIMYSRGSKVKIVRTLRHNTRFFSANETDKDEYVFESTDIVTNSHHPPLDQKTSRLTSGNIKDFFIDVIGHENGDNGTGIILLTDEKIESEEEMVISSGIDSLERNIKTFRVVIDEYFKKEVVVTHKGSLKEVHIRNFNVLGTVGTQLFPEICKEKRLSCSGGYRCLYSKVCIPLRQVCDKTTQCPYGDDEHFCDFQCPRNCSCAPSIINCSYINNEEWESNIIRELSPRSLNVANSTRFCQHILSSEMTRRSLTLLISLNMSRCNIDLLLKSSFSFLQNLIKLDISFNRFSVLKQDVFFHLKALQSLELSGNHHLIHIEPGAFSGVKIKSLTIKYTQLNSLSANTFKGLVLNNLDLSNNKISFIQDLSFNSLTCSAIDISGNPVTEFTKSMFIGVSGIKSLRTPAYKFCCARPSYLNEDDCLPHKDEFSSCKDLLRNSTLQALIWLIGVLALIGNVISLVYRFIYDTRRLRLGYGIFVTNLALADLLMGVYMMIIAVADSIFRDKYIEMDDYWRNSAWCRFAGVLSTLSSEASVLFMCLITIDRILVIKYPFGQYRITTKTAVISVLICWVFVFFLSLFPIAYTGYFQGQFYSKSAVCLALPLTRDRPPGWLYSFLIFIGFNMFTFTLIAVGQLLIYAEVKKHARLQKFLNKTRSNDLRVARNLLLVVATDFLCWFPVGVMGLLALAGKTVPGAVYAWTAVIVLPINSAINPFMYTLTAIIGRQKFNPSIDEQSRTDITKETGKAMLKLYPYVPTHKQRKDSTLISLADLMIDQRLTALDKILLIHRIFGFFDVLHQHDLVLGSITEQEVYILVSRDRKILGKIQMDLKRYPELSSKTNNKENDLYSCGCLLRRMLHTEMLS